MVREETKTAFKVVFTLLWIFFASYCFWGANEVTVTAPIDESGWVPDGAFARELIQASEQEATEGEA
ncbi:hypothetical protein ANTQUA_LOCUS9110 [Anthophora quadrimaculata]